MSGYVKSPNTEWTIWFGQSQHDEPQTRGLLDDNSGRHHPIDDNHYRAWNHSALASLVVLCHISWIFLRGGLANAALPRAAPQTHTRHEVTTSE